MALGPRARAYHGIGDDDLTDDQREIERLLRVCKDKTVLLQDAYAENERLRAALEEIAFENPSRSPAECALVALGRKPGSDPDKGRRR